MTLCDTICTNIMSYILGIFTAFFFYGWIEERGDSHIKVGDDYSYFNIETCINWELRSYMKLIMVVMIMLIMISCNNNNEEWLNNRVKEITLNDNTRCVIIVNGYYQPTGISCDWKK